MQIQFSIVIEYKLLKVESSSIVLRSKFIKKCDQQL